MEKEEIFYMDEEFIREMILNGRVREDGGLGKILKAQITEFEKHFINDNMERYGFKDTVSISENLIDYVDNQMSSDDRIYYYEYIRVKIFDIMKKFNITESFSVTFYGYSWTSGFKTGNFYRHESSDFSSTNIQLQIDKLNKLYFTLNVCYDEISDSNKICNDYFDSEVFENIILHEIGHIIDFRRRFKTWDDLAKCNETDNKIGSHNKKGFNMEVAANKIAKSFKPSFRHHGFHSHAYAVLKDWIDILYPKKEYRKKN